MASASVASAASAADHPQQQQQQSQTSANSASAASTAAAAPSATMTMTTAAPQNADNNNNEQQQVLRLTLRNPPSVKWDESVVDNEGMGRKSSKRCCIFHKQRPFGESSTDTSDEEADHDDDDDDANNNNGKRRPIARPKKNPSVPDYQRFHAWAKKDGRKKLEALSLFLFFSSLYYMHAYSKQHEQAWTLYCWRVFQKW